jgi:hypothetical protein
LSPPANAHRNPPAHLGFWGSEVTIGHRGRDLPRHCEPNQSKPGGGADSFVEHTDPAEKSALTSAAPEPQRLDEPENLFQSNPLVRQAIEAATGLSGAPLDRGLDGLVEAAPSPSAPTPPLRRATRTP